MAKRTEAENQAIRAKVTELQETLGYPIERAQATAFRMFRDGELQILQATEQLDRTARLLRANALDGFITFETSRRLQRKRFLRRLKILKQTR